jgi:hypothetical protein
MEQPLTWTCHICKAERPDDAILVLRHHRKLQNGVEYDENVRYCRDHPACFEAAQSFHFLPERA